MRRKLSPQTYVVLASLAAAVVLVIVNPSPSGLFRLEVGDQQVRAAPGTPTSEIKRSHDLTALRVFNRTLVRVRGSYVDPSRIHPKEMLYAALNSVQFNIPEVLVEADPQHDTVLIRVQDKTHKFSTADVDSPWRLSSKLKTIFRFIEANTNSDTDLADVEYAAVNGMLSTLDPHSILLNPELAREMDMHTSGKFGGLGIVIGMRDRELTVIRPIRGTPAHRAGLEPDDRIIRINKEVTENLTVQEAADRMRGDPGTKVVLWVRRKEEKKLRKFELTRAVIRVPSVRSRMLKNHVGYIRILQFASRTASEVRTAMDALQGQGATGWVLDLRWNPGGLLEQAIQVADLFLEQGTIVTTVGGHEREARRAERKSSDTDFPVVVLVNGSSASASEIVSGALKNLGRAVIVGNTTFGKGSVQILYDNDDGSKLKLTIAEYLTPGDRSIQSLGIVPNIALQRMFVPKENTDSGDQIRLLAPSHTYREEDLKAHLSSEYAIKGAHSDMTLSYLYEPPKKEAKEGDDTEEEDPFAVDEPFSDEIVIDYPIRLADEIVSSAGKKSAAKTLRGAKNIISRREQAQMKKLAAALGTLGVDWSAPPNAKAAPASLTASFSIPEAHPTVRAGASIELVGKVTNTGKTPAYQVHARVDSDHQVFGDTELVFGKIDPGQTRTWTVHIDIPEDARDRVAMLDFDVTSALGAKVEATPLAVRVVAQDRPVFAYSHQLIDRGNGDGLVQRGETYGVRVTIKNTGTGVAESTTALFRNTSGDGVIVKKGRFELGTLAPGQEKTVEFEVAVTPDLHEDELVMEMTVYDSVLRESVVDKLSFPVLPEAAGPKAATGRVQVTADKTPIYRGIADDSGAVAWAAKGAVFEVTGRVDGWVRIRLSEGRPGFVKADAVTTTRHRAHASLSPNWQVTPPTVTLQAAGLRTTAKSYHLAGKVTDDTHVEDVFVFVSNGDAKIDNKKVFYKSNREGDGSLDFSSAIPLWPGTNMITVIARENEDVKAAHTLFVYRSDKAATAHAAK
ncbi:MAG TPA: MXAN_5808 family serine peptidase [Kofleriaceae bacterium]|nr:MXAN_5808 family serine peptidase [Kofleriaceae bacterium]